MCCTSRQVRSGLASKAKAMRWWHKNDFDLSKAKNVEAPVTENVDDLVTAGNTLSFNASSSDFSLVIKGFDSRRDIIVDVKSEELTDEAV